MMNIAQFRPYDIANGLGIRCSLFVSGCNHHCPGCFNQSYQDFSYGEPWSQEIEEQLKTQLAKPEVDGLTLLGGEPMEHATDLTEILKRIKRQMPSDQKAKNIWIYSGYTFEQIKSDPPKLKLLQQCDVLVDGLFIEALKNPQLAFRGSSNQRIIDIKQSLQTGNIVLYDLS